MSKEENNLLLFACISTHCYRAK